MAKNQCDGCQAGIPVDEHGNHRMGTGEYSNLQGCTKDLYVAGNLTEALEMLVALAPKVGDWDDNFDVKYTAGLIRGEQRMAELAKKWLRYSFNDISFKYDGLTVTEKSFCTREEFAELVKWLGEVSGP